MNQETIAHGIRYITSSGCVATALEAALWRLLNTISHMAHNLKTATSGNDTNAVAATAGGLAGCPHGHGEISEKWFAGISGKDRIADISQQFSDSLSDASVRKRRVIDIHAHVLFDIDDGATDIDMSIAMLRQLQKQDVSDVICASHSWGDMRSYRDNFKLLQQTAKALGLSIHLHSGCEIFCDERLMDNLNRLKLPTIAMGKHVLLEFSPYTPAETIVRCARDVLELTPLIPIIAHAERYASLKCDVCAYNELRHRKIPIQINAFSLEEEKNVSTREFARQLLNEEKVMFLGSDAHRTTHRPPNIKSGVDYIYANCSSDYADAVCFRNAEHLLLRT